MNIQNNKPEEANIICHRRNEILKDMIKSTNIDLSAAYDKNFRNKIIKDIASRCKSVLDFGKSSRDSFELFSNGQVKIADIVDYGEYPDIFVDICDSKTFPDEKFDAIICLAILEHVYDPQAAVRNLYNALQDGGTVFCYVPFLFRYHAPEDLKYQDFFRFTRDGCAYLFRDFSTVTLYPVRGRLSTVCNLLGFWKAHVEGRFGLRIDRWIDSMASTYSNKIQASGYFILATR